MGNFGVGFGVAVAAGIAAQSALAIDSFRAVAILLVAAGLALRNAGSWILVPFALGLAAAAAADSARDERSVRDPLTANGWIEIVGREGRGAVLRVEDRRVLVAHADSLGLAPGQEVRGTLRIDPFVGAEEPAAFRAERWARTRGLDARGRFLGPIQERRDRNDPAARIRRLGESTRRAVRERLVGQGDAPGELLVALILGDRTGLDVDDREAFRRAGLAHVLALSGMHVSLLALGLGSVLGALRCGRVSTFAIQSAALVAFTMLTGCLAPVVRSCGTALLAGAAVVLERRSDALHALGLVAGVMLLADPVLLDDLGFRLSFTATALLVLAAGPASTRHTTRSRVRKAVSDLAASLRISTAIVLGTGADLAATMGSSSVLAPVTNLLSAIPSFAALGWGAFAAFAPLPATLLEPLARAARLANESILELCRAAAEVPGGNLATPAPGMATGVLALGVAATLARAGTVGGLAPRAALIAVGFALLAAAPRDRITFLDVGQGDSILLECNKERVLVDAGPPDARPSPDGSQLAERAVRRRGFGSLEAAALSHGHLDHGGGFASLLERRLTREFVMPRRAADARAPEHAIDLEHRARTRGVAVHVAGDVRTPVLLADGAIQIWSPWADPGPARDVEENDLSLVARWSAGRMTALLTGDLELEGERALVENTPARLVSAWLLKAGHHGGRTSTGDALLAAASPRVLVASCGLGNSHGHPHPEVLARAARRGILVLRTDHAGSIGLTRTGRGARVRWERGFPCALGR